MKLGDPHVAQPASVILDCMNTIYCLLLLLCLSMHLIRSHENSEYSYSRMIRRIASNLPLYV